MTTPQPPTGWRQALRRRIEQQIIAGDDVLDAARRRLDARFGRNRAHYIAAYRGFADSTSVELGGRVLANRPLGGPLEADDWWDNLLNTYRRFASDEVAGAQLRLSFRGTTQAALTDHEGYYQAAFATGPMRDDRLWAEATVALADGALTTPQPVLQVLPHAGFGVISDIDDTILHSGVTHWKTAAQLTFLHNARTRKPLEGVARLYQALQAGPHGTCAVGTGCNPIFYVSSSPWNLYDLLEDFMELNAIPPGPVFLRDLGTDSGKFIKTPGHGHKLERARQLIERFPRLRWVLLGDSGQADAELYAEAAREFGNRIAAIYIRDVDPDTDSPFDTAVDAHIERIAGTSVPMLRARDSLAMAEHAAGLGLLSAEALPAIAAEVRRDRQRPSVTEAAVEGAVEGADDAEAPAKSEPPEDRVG